jgi:hypothetical protein
MVDGLPLEAAENIMARRIAMATVTKERPTRSAAKKTDGLDDLSALAGATKAYEDEERAKTGSSNSFISLAQGNTGVLKPDSSAYIKGAKMYDYVIAKHNLRLGPVLDVTVLGAFKLYTECEKKTKESDLAKTVSFWMPDDAVQVPLLPGSNFDRQLPNGNTLQVTHWLFVYLHKHPEIDDALIAFKSVGNKVYNDLMKTIKANSSLCTELRFSVSKQSIKSKNYEEAYYYPKFEISGRNYKYEDGKVQTVKDGLDKDTLANVLRRSNELYESYKNMQMVSKKNLAAIVGPAARKALGAPSYEVVEDDESVTF